MKLNINWKELGIAVITQSTQNEDASGDDAATDNASTADEKPPENFSAHAFPLLLRRDAVSNPISE